MGSSPQQQQEEEMNLSEPLLRLHPRERNGSTTTAVGHSWLSQLLRSGTAGATVPNSAKLDCSAVTAYSRAGVLSRATFSWLNPLVKLGSIKTLQKEDVPQLAPQHRAARLHSLFHSHWREEGQETTVLHTLWSCFWGNILYTAFLALVKVGVTFVGPLLIQSFVDFCTESPSSSSSNTETTAATTDSRSKSSTWTQAAAPYSSSGQGLILVAILVAGKGVEVLFTHQYNFTCQKLGMQIRSALITAVYAKGLRLSSESRQRHGVGQIVNYMSVDAQQMSDVMIHLHTLWAVPLQTAVAIAILARVVGRSATLAGLLALSFTASMILAIARIQRKQQECIMQARDRRMRAFNESLTHMKVIKLQGWEEIFLKGVEDARRIEYMWLLKYVYSTAINILALWLTPLVTCVAIFSACIYFNDMTPAPGMAFTTVATVRTMEEPMRIFPQALIAVSQALVSLDRLDKYLWSKELEQDAVVKLPSDSVDPVVVKVECAFFKWDSKEEKATLSNINLAVNRGSFVTVVGKVGAGKSSLIASLLGEMPKLNGTVELRGSVAYVPQSPWIQHGTIEENILFGLPMDRERYDDTLQACALEMDIAQLDYGDQTEIGERGINLSGGQKQRIQLARAVYQNCDIYLLDDIFSALDAHTGSKIFQECVIEALIGKTVILVTHQIEFLHRANLILVMRDGTIVQSGTYEELSEAGLDFKDLVKAHSEALEKVNNNNNNNNNSTCDLWEDPFKPSYLDSPHLSTTSFSNLSSSCESISYLQHLEIPCSSPRCEEFNTETADLQLECNPLPFNGSLIHQFRGAFGRHPTLTTTTTSAAAQIIGCEERATGQVSRDIYWLYLTAAYGGAIVILLILVQFVWQMFQIASDYWIAIETSESESPASKHPATAGKNFQAEGFIRVYAMLALGCAVCVLIRSLLVAFIGITTSQKFYDKMLHSVFRAPMSFFDTTPLGRVLSRASTDQAQMDTIVPILSGGLLAIAFATTGILVVMVGVTWQLILIIIPLSWIYYSYQVYYLTTSRELTRVDALTKAPVIQHFSETIAGSMTIRCFGHQERFAHVNLERVDQNLKMDFHNNAANEWIGFRLESIGTFVLSIAAFLLVSLPSNLIQTELVGLYLSYALFFNARLFNMVMLVCQLEKSMVSVERINQYTQLESEAPLIIQNSRPPKSWPSKGTIEFRDLKLRYRENTPLVLKGVTVTIKGGRKVGIVGRTGSGKSTLVLALFRLVEPADGCILIDGIDIGTLGLSDLRANLSIIPQDPTLFNGTIRSNLDPMGLYSDQQIWEALQKCQLASSVQQLKAKLETSVLENGENWSVGQRQLFCLGRALLKDTQILVLDEATASVDAETDALILKTVQEVFASRTVISIAHRIPTIMNSDKVLVLEAGKVKEYGSPSKLLQDSTSVFASLVSKYSTRSSCSTSDLTAFDELLPS